MASNVSPKVEALLKRAELGRDNNNQPNMSASQIADRKYKTGAAMRTQVRKLTGKPMEMLNVEEQFLAMEQVFTDYATPKLKSIADSNKTDEQKMVAAKALEGEMKATYPAGFKLVDHVNQQRQQALEQAPKMMAGMAAGDPNAGYKPSTEGMFPEPNPDNAMVAGQGGPVPGSLKEELGNGLQ